MINMHMFDSCKESCHSSRGSLLDFPEIYHTSRNCIARRSDVQGKPLKVQGQKIQCKEVNWDREYTMLTFIGTGCISKTLRRLVSNSSMMSELIRSHRGLSGLLQCNKVFGLWPHPLSSPIGFHTHHASSRS